MHGTSKDRNSFRAAATLALQPLNLFAAMNAIGNRLAFPRLPLRPVAFWLPVLHRTIVIDLAADRHAAKVQAAFVAIPGSAFASSLSRWL